jgi:hypothetical protein
MRKGTLLRRVSFHQLPVKIVAGVSEGPYVMLTSPRESHVKIGMQESRLCLVIDVYTGEEILRRQPLSDFVRYED